MNYDSSLTHTRWNCKYHIVFVPKYRRKVIYGKLRADICAKSPYNCLNVRLHGCLIITQPKISNTIQIETHIAPIMNASAIIGLDNPLM